MREACSIALVASDVSANGFVKNDGRGVFVDDAVVVVADVDGDEDGKLVAAATRGGICSGSRTSTGLCTGPSVLIVMASVTADGDKGTVTGGVTAVAGFDVEIT
jgi:hypothetical protein